MRPNVPPTPIRLSKKRKRIIKSFFSSFMWKRVIHTENSTYKTTATTDSFLLFVLMSFFFQPFNHTDFGMKEISTLLKENWPRNY